MANTTKYFVQNGSNIEGPYVLHDVLNLPLTHETLIWKEGMQSWSKLTELEEFSNVFAKTPPPLVIDFDTKKAIVEESALLEKNEAIHHNRANRYFIYSDNKTTGPFSLEQIKEMKLGSDALLWKDGMTTWEKQSEFKEFESASHTPPPLPAGSNNKQTVRETVTHKRGGSSLLYIILLLCVLLLFLFFFCRLNSCCCHSGVADTTANQKNIIAKPDTAGAARAIADSTANALAAQHNHYLNEIGEQINKCYLINGSDFPSVSGENNEVSGDPRYVVYFNNIPKELKDLYISDSLNVQDNAGHSVNTDSANYFKYIDYIHHEVVSNFTASIDTTENPENSFDRTYLLCVEKILQGLNAGKTDHPHYNTDNRRRHTVQPLPIRKPGNNNVDNFSYYQYPEIFLGHSVNDIFKAYGDKYTSDDDLQNDSYTITYYSPYYEKNYTIDKQTDSCTKFSIKFYLGSYYNWYLAKMLPGANAINNANRSWTSNYENKPIEIDLKTVGRSTPVLVYSFTESEAN